MKNILLGLAALLFVVHGTVALQNAVADVATDLDLDAATPGVRLYWLDKETRLVEGTCQAEMPILRTNCSQSIRGVDKEAFEKAVLKDAKAKVELAEMNFVQPKKNFRGASDKLQERDDFEQEMNRLKVEIPPLKADVGNLVSQKRVLSAELSKVEEELVTHPTEALKAKRQQLLIEIWNLQEELKAKDKSLTEKSARLKTIEDLLPILQPRDVLLRKLEEARVPYLAAKAVYESAHESFELAVDSVGKATDDIVYEILSSNGEYSKNRPSVKLFKDALDRVRLKFEAGYYSEDYGRSKQCIHHLEVINGTTIALSFSGTSPKCKDAHPVTLRCNPVRCEGSNDQIRSVTLQKQVGPGMYQCSVAYTDGSSSTSGYASHH